mmetsp:Transcript_4725/g.12022  ORF Transcript_4725/g.12022 Transcript_4725/m.12022 type:complete len:321 (+) Transcript_4725:158-1120(+)
MPHLFVNRRRFHGSPFHPFDDESGNFRWEIINAVAYQLGGFIFTAGSVLFLPRYEAYVGIGSILFVIGSIFYLVVSGHDLYEVKAAHLVGEQIRQRKRTEEEKEKKKNSNNGSKDSANFEESPSQQPLQLSNTQSSYNTVSAVSPSAPASTDDDNNNIASSRNNTKIILRVDPAILQKWKLPLDFLSAIIYFVGTILFIAGSILFLPRVAKYTIAAWMFIVGSLCFIVGAFVNSVQIFQSPTGGLALYANVTASCYTVGSTLFLTGSIPYLWTFDTEDDRTMIDRYLGWQFILGSLCFTAGGFINLVRVILHRKYVKLGV